MGQCPGRGQSLGIPPALAPGRPAAQAGSITRRSHLAKPRCSAQRLGPSPEAAAAQPANGDVGLLSSSPGMSGRDLRTGGAPTCWL